VSADKNIDYILTHCGALRESESLIILCDNTTRDLGEAFKSQAVNITRQANLIEIPLANKHGEEPPLYVQKLMSQASMVVSLCKYSLAHSKARIEAASHGARFLSMPCYSWDLLNDPAVTLDFKSQAPIVKRIADAFTAGSFVYVTTRSGTDIAMDIRSRKGNCCPGFVSQPGELGSPPDIEANVSPLEDESKGSIVVDGSITCPEIGLLEQSVRLALKVGKVQKIESKNKYYVEALNRIFGELDSKRRVLAECGVGLNPLAKLSGVMLTDEGALGGVHFGFGSNHTVGGKNEVDFHLDFVVRTANLMVDKVFILKDGELMI